MIPARVCFTGLEFDPMAILQGRIHRGPIPPEWPRIRFQTEERVSADKMNRWLTTAIEGRWACWVVFTKGERHVMVAFENETDAVVFRLKGGERSWAEAAPE